MGRCAERQHGRREVDLVADRDGNRCLRVHSEESGAWTAIGSRGWLRLLVEAGRHGSRNDHAPLCALDRLGS